MCKLCCYIFCWYFTCFSLLDPLLISLAAISAGILDQHLPEGRFGAMALPVGVEDKLYATISLQLLGEFTGAKRREWMGMGEWDHYYYNVVPPSYKLVYNPINYTYNHKS